MTNPWNGWGNFHSKAVNENDESPITRNLGCFLSQSSNPSKTDEQQETSMPVLVQEEPNKSNFQNNPWETTFVPSPPKPSNQTSATSLPIPQTWSFGEPTSSKPKPARRHNAKKQKVGTEQKVGIEAPAYT